VRAVAADENQFRIGVRMERRDQEKMSGVSGAEHGHAAHLINAKP